ncbi:MAG: polyprenyl synthetase family protein [Bacteroidaceae bacterium]
MDMLSAITSPITDELVQFKELFDSSLTNSNPLLNEVLVHICQRRGKMMRPILVLLVAKLSGGGISKSTLHAAVALELLHTASLVHDDVVDESGERRGQLSVNAMYNNRISVLAGDYLLATCLVQSSLTQNNDIVGVVARLGQDLSEGELLQLSNVSNSTVSESIYFDVIRKKTAVLFAACTKSAALSVGMSVEKAERYRLLGEYIGICFQIKDDIFDYYDGAGIGKPTGNDMREGKLTLPAIYALTSSNDKTAKDLAAKIKTEQATNDEISHFIEFTKLQGGIEYATKIMYEYKDKASRILLAMPDSEVRASLIAYLNYVVDREK